MGRRATSARPHEPRGMAIIHHGQTIIGISNPANFPQISQIAVHRKHTIRRNHHKPRATRPCRLYLALQIRHIAVLKPKPPRFAQPDAVNDRGMVQAVRNNRILLTQQRLKQPAIGVKTGGKQNGILHPEKPRQARLQSPVQILRAANEPDRGHAIAMARHRRLCCRHQSRIIGQPQIIVGAESQHPPPANGDMRPLCTLDQAFTLHQPIGLNLGQGCTHMVQKSGICHGGNPPT